MSAVRVGWLVEQLPGALSTDPFVPRFVGIFEEIAGTLRQRVEGLEHVLDVGLAPPEFVRWMGTWLGLTVQPSLPEDRQRTLVAAAGTLWVWRGTRRGLQGLLEAYTGAVVGIEDSGGVFAAGRGAPGPKRVVVRLTGSGELDEAHLLELVRRELPPDAALELRVASHVVQQPAGDPEAPEE